jgi:hypothetical protein
MIAESLIKNNKITIPNEILKKIGKNGNIAKWDINDKGKIEIEIIEIPKECIELSEELDELNDEIERGEGVTLTTEELAKKLGVDYQ